MKGSYGVKKNMLKEGEWAVLWVGQGYIQPFASYKSEKIAAGVMWLLNKLDGK